MCIRDRLESIKRVDEHQNQQTGDCADKGAKHRDDVGNANHDRDQRGKLDAKNGAAAKSQHANDGLSLIHI